MQGATRIQNLEGIGFIQSNLGSPPSHTGFVEWNDEIDFEAELNQFQDLNFPATSAPNTHCNPELDDVADFLEDMPYGIDSRDRSIIEWCEQLTQDGFNESNFDIKSEAITEPLNSFNFSEPQDSNSVILANDASHCDSSEVGSVHSTTQGLHRISKDRSFDFLSQTKIEFDSSDEDSFVGKRKRRATKRQKSSDSEYKLSDDEDFDGEDEEDWIEGKKKGKSRHAQKRFMKKSDDEEEEGFDENVRKRKQNKRAAIKYRDKKKREDADREALLERLTRRNVELKRQQEEKQHELQVLRRLFNSATRSRAPQ